MKLHTALRYISFVAFLLFNITGCSLHQVDTPNPGELPDTYNQLKGKQSQNEFIDKWWEHFKDPQLTDIIETALANNLDIVQAVARFQQSQSMFYATNAGNKPFLNFEGQVSRDSQPGMNGTTTSNNYRLSLAAGYEIDLWQKTQSLADAAWAETLASKEAVKSIFISISASVGDLYFLTRSLEEQLLIKQNTISSLTNTEQLILNRYNNGLATSQELYKASANLASAKMKKSEVKANLATTKHSLAVLLGYFPNQSYKETMIVPMVIPKAFPSGLPSDLLTKRPDIQAAKQAVIAKDKSLGVAIANRFPSVNLLASYGQTNNPITDTFWSLFAGLTKPLIDGGTRRAEVDRSKATLKEALAHYQQTVLQAVREVEDSLVENRAAEKKRQLAQKQHDLATSTLHVTKAQYQNGIADFLAVLTAERNLLESEALLSETSRQLISHRISLARALGGSWTEDYVQNTTE